MGEEFRPKRPILCHNSGRVDLPACKDEPGKGVGPWIGCADPRRGSNHLFAAMLLAGKYSRENQKPEDSRRTAFDFPIVDKERTWRILDVLRPIAQAHETSVATVVLSWTLAKPFVTSVIIGAKRVDQLQQNLAGCDVQLTADEIKSLDEVSALPPEYPGWMVPFQNMNRLADVPRF
jgi:hypothetical protein